MEVEEPNPLLAYLPNGYGNSNHTPSEFTPEPELFPPPLPDVDPPPDTAITDLSAELPVVLNDLIPLSYLVERVVGQAYSDLANLVEILPSTEDDQKKRKIVDYVLQTRRLILKLLVLVRWSSEAPNVGKCMNIIGFLGRQNYEFDHAVDSLTDAKSMLAAARVRNYDIPTALSVLTSGTYTRLPSLIAEAFAVPPTLPDEVVLRTLQEVDAILRWRLCCVEKVPLGMSNYTIKDGRATFRSENMWEATMTYGGQEDDASGDWYLLSLKFLFKVRDARGVWASTPIGSMKEHIVELCNGELARRPPSSDSGSIEDGTPLVRGYSFLQRVSLSYQLEALYAQAVQLAATQWAGNLRPELSADRSELRIEYWTPPPPPKAQVRNPPPVTIAHGFAITVSIGTARSRTATTVTSGTKSEASAATDLRRSIRHRALQRSLQVAEGMPIVDDVGDSLSLSWQADGLSEEQRSQVPLHLESDLDVESLLLRTTAFHARETILQLYHQLSSEMNPDDLELCYPTPPPYEIEDTPERPVSVPSMHIHLHGQHYIVASINTLTGRLEFKSLGDVSAAREMRLRGAAEKVDKDRKQAGETLARVRSSTIVDEVESRATFLGLQTTRRINLRPADISKFGQGTRTFLFVSLPKLPNHFLVLVLSEDGFRFALLSVREGADAMQTWLQIEELGWLDKSSSGGGWNAVQAPPLGFDLPQPYGFDVSIEDLRDLHQYCVRRIAFFKVEQQLHVRRIPYKHVASFSPASSPTSSPDSPVASNSIPTSSPSSASLSKTSPYLVIQSTDLLSSAARVAFPNIAIMCYMNDDLIRTSFHVRFRDLSSLVQPTLAELPNSMTYDPKTSIVTFTSEDVDTCIPTFLTAYSLVARSIILARHRQTQKDGEAVGPLEGT